MEIEWKLLRRNGLKNGVVSHQSGLSPEVPQYKIWGRIVVCVGKNPLIFMKNIVST